MAVYSFARAVGLLLTVVAVAVIMRFRRDAASAGCEMTYMYAEYTAVVSVPHPTYRMLRYIELDPSLGGGPLRRLIHQRSRT
jgi:hypothetical protein